MPMKQTENGWEFTIDPGLGPSKVQVFKGATQEEVYQKIEAAQISATHRIDHLRTYVDPDRESPVTEFKPRELTVEERYQLGADLQDPTKAVAAQQKILEATFGGTADQVRTALQSATIIRLTNKYRKETSDWLQENPEFRKTPRNHEAMMKWLDAQESTPGNFGIPPSKKNLTLAFNALKETPGGLPDGFGVEEVEESPAGAEPGNEQPGDRRIAGANGQERIAPGSQPAGRPRGPQQSSGIRNADSSGSRQPARPAAKWTRQQVLAMDSKEYDLLIKTDPKFVEFVDNM